jgi:hypothetical protein
MTQWGLDVLFNPAKRHMDEEKRRLQSTREEIGDSSGGKRIDLESGKVVIPRSDADGEDATEDATADAASGDETPAAENAASKDTAKGKTKVRDAAESEKADTAAARARARRQELRQKGA